MQNVPSKALKPSLAHQNIGMNIYVLIVSIQLIEFFVKNLHWCAVNSNTINQSLSIVFIIVWIPLYFPLNAWKLKVLFVENFRILMESSKS